MSHPEDDSPVGKWVHVISGGSDAYTGAPTSEFGVLEARDAAFLYVHRADGEVVILPMASVRSLRVIQPPPPIPGGTLLRPASADDLLLTPAGSMETDPALLLHPASAPDQPLHTVGGVAWWLRLLRVVVRLFRR